MTGINLGRVIGGGLVAGLVMNVIDAGVNGALLSAEWMIESKRLGLDLSPAAQTRSMIGWITYDFVCGIALVWLYAAIRPRFGPGPGTAACAGATCWFLTHVAFAAWVFLGIYSFGLIAQSTLGSLGAFLFGALAGCALYKEA